LSRCRSFALAAPARAQEEEEKGGGLGAGQWLESLIAAAKAVQRIECSLWREEDVPSLTTFDVLIVVSR